MYTGTDDVIALVKFAHPGTDFDHAASCLDTCKGKLKHIDDGRVRIILQATLFPNSIANR
jgi:hypothetical protein